MHCIQNIWSFSGGGEHHHARHMCQHIHVPQPATPSMHRQRCGAAPESMLTIFLESTDERKKQHAAKVIPSSAQAQRSQRNPFGS